MSFFNSKEEVLDIELTQYGKTLLSRGLLKPVYYSFHDDDVLYDIECVGLTENTNFAEVRIQEETPVHKPFYSFKQAKPFLSNDINQQNFMAQKANLAVNSINLQSNILSNSTISNLYVPSWEIYNLSSNFLSSSLTFTTKNVVSASIPQFDVTINTDIYITNQEQIDENISLQNLFSLAEENVLLENEQIYILLNNPLLIKIVENNIDTEADMLEVEMFKIVENADGEETYTQLKISKEIDNYDSINDLYVRVSRTMEQTTNSEYADYYFDILADKEISNLNACRFVLTSEEQQDQIFDDINVCNSYKRFITNDLYAGMPDLATGKTC